CGSVVARARLLSSCTTAEEDPMAITALAAPPVPDAPRPRLMSRAYALVLVAGAGSATSFYLLFSALPRYADATGAGGVGAGLTTGVMMLAAVATELVVSRAAARFGYRAVFTAGLVLLGLPALALTASGSMAVILLVCLVRGAGFAVAVVLGGALVLPSPRPLRTSCPPRAPCKITRERERP